MAAGALPVLEPASPSPGRKWVVALATAALTGFLLAYSLTAAWRLVEGFTW